MLESERLSLLQGTGYPAPMPVSVPLGELTVLFPWTLCRSSESRRQRLRRSSGAHPVDKSLSLHVQVRISGTAAHSTISGTTSLTQTIGSRTVPDCPNPRSDRMILEGLSAPRFSRTGHSF